MNIESMYMFNFLHIVYYICQSRSNTILYSMLLLFVVVKSNFQHKRDWKNLNGDLLQPSRIRYDSISFGVSFACLFSNFVSVIVLSLGFNFHSKWDWKNLNGDLLQPSRIMYDSRSFSVICLVSLAYWEGIDFSCLSSYCGTTQAIGSFSL